MAKKSRGSAKKGAAKKKRSGARKTRRTTTTNLQRLLNEGAIDPDAANALDNAGMSRIEALSSAEVGALISAHLKVSPNKRWKPDPDGSIF